MNLQLPQSVQAQGTPPAFPINMALIMSMKTLKTYSDGAADIETRFVDGKMEIMGQVMPFPQQANSQAFRLRIGKKGNIIRFLTALPTGQQNLFAGFDPNMMIQSMSGFAVFPEEAVGVGDKWEQKMELNLPFGKMNMIYKMNLVGFVEAENQKLARIKIDIPPTPFTFAMPIGMPGAQAGGEAGQVPTLQMSGKMETKSDMLFNYEKGQMSSQVGTLKMTMNMTPPEGELGPAGGFSMDMEMNMKFKVTFSEKKPALPQNLSQIQIVIPEEQNQ